METKLLPYRYEFNPNEWEAIQECKERHGFAIVKKVLSDEQVELLKAEVRRVIEPGFTDESRLSITDASFIEKSQAMADLLVFEPLMRIAAYLNGNRPMTLNRSAAIYKKPGAAGNVANSGAHAWHTDWDPLEPPYGANAVLNNSGAASLWFYLTGSTPHNGGLAILPDSHTDDWPGPEGFEFTAGRKSFYRKGTDPLPYCDMDVPGMIPVITDPGDLVVFAERTYHGVNAHKGTEARLSCAMSFRPRGYSIGPCWPLPESARQFIDSCPADRRHLVEEYVGIDTAWRYDSGS